MNSYSEYAKVSINSYTNMKVIYNITIAPNGDLKITLEPNSEVKQILSIILTEYLVYKEVYNMEIKQIYLYDGTPFLVMENKDGELNYPKEQWTDIAPRKGLYAPIHFDGKNG